MKTILFIFALLIVGCSTEPIDTDNKPVSCGIIVSSGEDQRGDYIEVKMPNYNQIQKDRYKVYDYREYKLSQEICNFEGMIKQPN